MKHKSIFILLLLIVDQLKAQDTLALSESPQAVAAKHQYHASYWNWRSHKADYLPSLSLSSYSSLNRSISPVTLPDGSDSFVHRNQLLNDGALTLNQNIAFLGGSFFAQSGLQRLDLFTDKNIFYKSTPLVIGYRQNIFGYNYLQWNKRIEPVRYSAAQKQFTENEMLQLNSNLPDFFVPVEEALQLARENSPDVEFLRLQEMASESAVAQAKASRGFKADLYVQFGLTQTDNNLTESYRNPLDQQLVSLGINIPILDWGVGRGRVEVAKSNLERTKVNIEQARTDFDANVVKLVKQFNLQSAKVDIAKKTADRAIRRNDVAYRLYLLGKSSVLDLNAAISEKDNSQRTHIKELSSYWAMYYMIRSMTGWDFESRKLIVK